MLDISEGRSKLSIPQKKYVLKDITPKHPEESVFERHLVTQKLSRSVILDEYQRYSSNTTHRHFTNPSLGFLTSWNTNIFIYINIFYIRYDFSSLFIEKFDMLSPCWLEIKDQDNSVIISVSNTINDEWIKNIRDSCIHNIHCPLLLPRVTFNIQGIQSQDKETLLNSMTLLLNEYDFDGFVLELPLTESTISIYTLIRELLYTINPNKQFILISTVNPSYFAYMNHLNTLSISNSISKIIDYFVLMTYDYSVRQGKIGPNAPIHNVEDDIDTFLNLFEKSTKNSIQKKLLLGIAFYGYDITEPIINNGYIDILMSQNVPFTFHKDSKEHSFKYIKNGKIHEVYYPTLYSIQERLDLCKQRNIGYSIWELGQGSRRRSGA
ncbi:hypothetical protein WA158_004969 [Blastocystis sp. Blastoise]